jgi:hypothetical protein
MCLQNSVCVRVAVFATDNGGGGGGGGFCFVKRQVVVGGVVGGGGLRSVCNTNGSVKPDTKKEGNKETKK